MRYGISWELDSAAFNSVEDKFQALVEEARVADSCGINSAWLTESHDDGMSVSSPAMLLTNISQQTKSIHLGIRNRQLTHAHPVRLAEEFATLDLFSRGRAAIAFESAAKQGLTCGQLHETIEFILAAWSRDNIRYNGEYVKFPTSLPEDAAPGLSTQPATETFVPQWLRNNALEDYVTVRPKPYVIRPIIHVSIEEDETLEWAARNGISPIIYADVPTQEAIAQIEDYRQALNRAGRSLSEVEIVVEREMNIDGPESSVALGGSVDELACKIRHLADTTGLAHFVWKRKQLGSEELAIFVNQIVLGIQA